MKKIMIGILLGILAGIMDIIPMIIQKLTWDANISAFSMWIVVGIFISLINFKIPVIIGSMAVAFLVLLPSAILIGWKEPLTLIPIFIMTLVLSSILGFSINFIKKKLHMV